MFISAAAPVEGGRVGTQWAAGAAARLRPRLGAFGKRGPDYPKGRALAAPAPPWAASPTQSRDTRGGPIRGGLTRCGSEEPMFMYGHKGGTGKHAHPHPCSGAVACREALRGGLGAAGL